MANRYHHLKGVSKNKFRSKDINFYVCQYIRHRLGGFDLDEGGREFKYLLKKTFEDLDGSYRAFYTKGVDSVGPLPFDYHFNKFKKPASQSGESDNRKGVFDELVPILLAEENCRAKILFPDNKADNHWVVGELVLDKIGKKVSATVFAHDPYGQSIKLSTMKFKMLEDRLKGVFGQFDIEVSSQVSPYTLKRLSIDDVISSGVIVVDELIKRIVGESLTLSGAYPVGARQLRECQISRLLEEVCSDEAQSYIENIALMEDNITASKKLVLSVKEIRGRLCEIINSNEAGQEKARKLHKIEVDFYQPLVKQLASSISFEELKDLVIVFDDLISLVLPVSDSMDQLEYLTDAAVYCQYMQTILEEKFTVEQRSKFLKHHCINPSKRWNEIQENFVMKIGGKMELLPNMALETEKYRQMVMKMRTETKIEIELIEEQVNKLKKINPQDMDENRNSIVKPVRLLFECIAKDMKSLFVEFYNDSEKIMVTPPPCRYAVIGLGSLALQQITPYSDFEFAILTELDAPEESDILNYFKNLSHLMNLKIIGLGETGIPFSKFQVDLDHFVHIGINFDLGGKTSLGRRDKFYNLIGTVSEMLKYVYNKDDEITHIDKNLPYILENVCYVSGDKELVEEYQRKVSNFLNQTNADGQKNCELRALKVLEEGAVEFDYANKQANMEPTQKKFQGDLQKMEPKLDKSNGKYFNVKQEIYRLSERMVYNLGSYFGVEGKSCWDTIEKLKCEHIISECAQKNLLYAVSFANLLRLKTYYKNKSQTGEISLYPKSSNDSETTMLELTEEDLEENGELFNYFYRAFPLYKKLEELCAEHKELIHSEKHFVLQNEPFFDSSSGTKGLIYFRLNQFENALRHLVPALETLNHGDRLSLLEVISIAYRRIGYHDLSLQYLEEILEIKKAYYKETLHSSVANALFKIGNAYYLLGDYDLALQYCNEGLDMLTVIFNNAAHPFVADCLNIIGFAYLSKESNELALQYLKESLRMKKVLCKDLASSDVVCSLNNIGSVYLSIGDNDSALQYLKEGLDMLKELYKGGAHSEIANLLHNVGSVHLWAGDRKLALQYYKESINMLKVMFKDDPHPSIAYSLKAIGDIYESEGNPALALQYCMESLYMQKSVFTNTVHPDYANTLHSIGCAYLAEGDKELAFKYLKEGLDVFKAIFKGAPHSSVITSLSHVGLIYKLKGDHDLALVYSLESLDMQKLVFKDFAHNPYVATTFNVIGNIYKSKGDYKSALKYFEKGFKIFQNIGHPRAATLWDNMCQTNKLKCESNANVFRR